MKRLLLVVTALLVLVLGGISCAVSAPPTPAPTAIEVTAQELHSAYEANQVAADAKYKDRILKVTGEVTTIDKDLFGTPYVVLAVDGKYVVGGVRCLFDKKYEPELAQLTKGQTITVQGKCTGEIIWVNVEDCVLVR